MAQPEYRRAVENMNRGPSQEEIADAMDEVFNHSVPGTPRTGASKLVREKFDLPTLVGTRKVKEIKIAHGNPRHGAMRSDDHLSKYEVELPLAEVSNEVVRENACSCGCGTALYRYQAHHNIAGSEVILCTRCEETHHEERWG